MAPYLYDGSSEALFLALDPVPLLAFVWLVVLACPGSRTVAAPQLDSSVMSNYLEELSAVSKLSTQLSGERLCPHKHNKSRIYIYIYTPYNIYVVYIFFPPRCFGLP